jgi:hypothetical protein
MKKTFTILDIKNELASDFDIEVSNKELEDIFKYIKKCNISFDGSSKCWDKLDDCIEKYLKSNNDWYNIRKFSRINYE